LVSRLSQPRRVFTTWLEISSCKSFLLDQSPGFWYKFYRQKEYAQNDNCVTVISTIYLQCCNNFKHSYNQRSFNLEFGCPYNVIPLNIKIFPFLFVIPCVTDPDGSRWTWLSHFIPWSVQEQQIYSLCSGIVMSLKCTNGSKLTCYK